MTTNYGLLGITPQDRQQAAWQGLMNLGGTLMAGGAPTTDIGQRSRGWAAAGPAFTQSYEGNTNKAIARNLQGLQLQTAQRAADWRAAIGAGDIIKARGIDPVATASYVKDQYLPVDPSQDLYRIGGDVGQPPSVPGTSPVPSFLVREAQQQQTPASPSAVTAQRIPYSPNAQDVMDSLNREQGVTAQMSLSPQPLTDSPGIPSSLQGRLGVSPASQAAGATTSSIPGMTLVREATPEWTQVTLPNGRKVLQSRDGEIKDMPGQPDPTKEYGPEGLTQKGIDARHREWRTAVKPQIEETDKINTKLGKVRASLAQETGSGDIAAINSFVRMIDDGVVRGEDIRLQQSAVSVVERLKIWKAQAQEGELLGENLRANMQRVAEALQHETMMVTSRRLADVKSIVDRMPGLEWSMVVPEWRRVYETYLTGPPQSKRPNNAPVSQAPQSYEAVRQPDGTLRLVPVR